MKLTVADPRVTTMATLESKWWIMSKRALERGMMRYDLVSLEVVEGREAEANAAPGD